MGVGSTVSDFILMHGYGSLGEWSEQQQWKEEGGRKGGLSKLEISRFSFSGPILHIL